MRRIVTGCFGSIYAGLGGHGKDFDKKKLFDECHIDNVIFPVPADHVSVCVKSLAAGRDRESIFRDLCR